MESRMRGNSHVRFGAGDEETCLGNGARRFIPTLPEPHSALSLSLAGGAPHPGIIATNHHTARIGSLRQPPDQGELRIAAFAAHDDLDPMTKPADMGITKPMVGAGDEALHRLVEAHARRQDQKAGPRLPHQVNSSAALVL